MTQRLVIISGPTACGKDVITEELLRRFPVLTRVVTATTRPKRRDDRHGVDYFFESKEHFERMIAAGELMEWAVVHGNYYGLPKAALTSVIAADRVPILTIDVQGEITVKKTYPDTFSIFLYPEPWDAYFERLVADRGSEKNFAARVESIRHELEESRHYDTVLPNHEGRLQETTDAVVDVVATYLDVKPLPAFSPPPIPPPAAPTRPVPIGR